MIRFIFPTAAEEVNGTIQWSNFVQAICDVGFVARQAGGSAVSFEAEGQGRIVFHNPHRRRKSRPSTYRLLERG